MVSRQLWICLLLTGCTHGVGREAPVMVLRCLDGQVSAYMAMEVSDEGEPAGEMIPVQLDSAPECGE